MTRWHRKVSGAPLLIAAVALIPVVPYLLGYAGQDFEFHLSSWMSMRDAWHTGQLSPTWAAAANFGMGDPHLGFYPPISLMLGGLLMLVLPVQMVPAVFVWVAISASGLAMYYASTYLLPAENRLPAAVVYMLCPYLLATALVRFAAGELLLHALLPLVLLSAYECLWVRDRRPVVLLGALLGLGWLTNIPGSIMLAYGLVPLAILCAVDQRSFAPLNRLLAAECLGVAVAAFRVWPAWVERGWIHQAALTSADPRRFLLFWRPPPFPFNILMFLFWILGAGSAVIIVACLQRRKLPFGDDPAARTWAYLAGIAVFFQLPVSYPAWTYLPQLWLVQHPFRFLALLDVALPLILFSEGTRRDIRKPAYDGFAMMASMPVLMFLVMIASPENHWRPLNASLSMWKQHGYRGAAEYVPATATAPDGPVTLSALSVLNPEPKNPCTVTPLPRDRGTLTFKVDSKAGCSVRIATFDYPAWQAIDETGGPVATTHDQSGLFVVAVPAGSHTVQVSFHGRSRVRTISSLLSLATVLALPGLWWRRKA